MDHRGIHHARREKPRPGLPQGAGRDHRAEAIALLKLLYERRDALGMPHAKPLGKGLHELRGQQVRIFYTFHPGKRIILLDGMVKKRDDIPADIMARVRGYLAEVQAERGKQ